LLLVWELVAVASAAVRIRLPKDPPTLRDGPAIVVLVACKGETAHSRKFFQHLMAQRYRPFRVILAVESAEDSALALLRLPGMAERTETAVAAPAQNSSQKVANLIAGWDRLRSSDEILVLADADHLPPPEWLGRLAAMIVAGDADVVTGYRLQLPTPPSFATCLAAALDLAVAMTPRPRFKVPCWGGCTAAWRRTWEQAGVRAGLAGSFNDDLMASELFDRAGHRVRAPHDLMLPSEISQDLRGLLNYAPRQYLQVRWYAPFAKWVARLLLPLPVLGWAAGFAATAAGFEWGWLALAFGYAAAFAKAFQRRSLVRSIAGAPAMLRWRCVFWLTALVPWFLALVHFLLAYKGLFARSTVWAGTSYRIDAAKDVKVFERRPGVPA
jgi:hypothetical protein